MSDPSTTSTTSIAADTWAGCNFMPESQPFTSLKRARDEAECDEETKENHPQSDDAEQQQSSKRMRAEATFSSAQRFFTNGLHCISAFLSLRDALPSYHACRNWYAAALSEPCRQVRMTDGVRSPINLAFSPLRFHVIEVLEDVSEMKPQEIMDLPRQVWPNLKSVTIWPPVEELRLITALSEEDQEILKDAVKTEAQAGNLCYAVQAHQRVRDAENDPSLPPASRRDILVTTHLRGSAGFFPPYLTALDILMDADRFTRDMQQWKFNVCSLISNPTLTRLSIALPPPHDPPIDISTLYNLPNLKQLFLNHIVLNEEHFAVLRQLSSLELLSTSGISWTLEQLQLLCRPGHQLQQLRTLRTRFADLSAAHCIELMNLPAFRSLSFAAIQPDALPYLSKFPSLRKLDFCSGVSNESSVSALCACKQLTDLTLRTTFNNEENRQLALSLQSLHKLTLAQSTIMDLSFLELLPRSYAAVPFFFSSSMAPTPTVFSVLESLTLRDCRSLPTSQLRYVISPHALPSLTNLTIIDSFIQPLDGFARLTLDPPSRHLPKLKSFVIRDQRPMPE